jgi:hypothetical protein
MKSSDRKNKTNKKTTATKEIHANEEYYYIQKSYHPNEEETLSKTNTK